MLSVRQPSKCHTIHSSCLAAKNAVILPCSFLVAGLSAWPCRLFLSICLLPLFNIPELILDLCEAVTVRLTTALRSMTLAPCSLCGSHETRAAEKAPDISHKPGSLGPHQQRSTGRCNWTLLVTKHLNSCICSPLPTGSLAQGLCQTV